MDAATIKEWAGVMGADICGIAPVDRFADAPPGFHPADICEGCLSVIVFASRFPTNSIYSSSPAPYTFVRNRMVERLDMISFALSEELERAGIVSVPIPSSEPYDFWDADRRHGRGILSLKHAGVLAGLGVLGKNTLLINETFGNMIWLGAVLVSDELAADPVASYTVCADGCSLCLDSCPQHALDGTTIDQRRCRERSMSSTEGGGWVLSCNICRKVCPNLTGI
ncbi:MAG: epoxyqueuosine reductase [Deltaproteobacteria bacterium]|nr:epoxyqueuosine reductase [Candidatus Zymogenaceae bacterium]